MAVAGKLMTALGAAWTLASAYAAAAPRTYFDAAVCAADGVHVAAQCRQAYRNARAEFDEKAPRFATRAACERHFPRCMIADIFSHGGVDFMPAMRGFVFVEGRRTLAVPVAEGGAGEGLFEPRAADRADVAIDPRRAAAARSAWLLKPARPAKRREVAEPETSGVAEEPRAFPVPNAMLIELRDRERRYAGTTKNLDQ